jgi:hypothetical protein
MSDVIDATEELSLHDTIAAAYDSAAEVEQVETETQTQERLRDEQGRFARKEEEAAAHPVEATVEAPEVQARKAPQSWKEEYKAQFSALPEAIQEEILRRETDYSKGIQRYAETAKYGEAFKPVVDRWQPYLSQLQVAPDQAFDVLIQAEYKLRNGSPTEKLQALQKLASDYGIPLEGAQNQEQRLDPNLQHALSRVQQLEETIRKQQYTQQQSEQAEYQKLIDNFSRDPKHPHFDSVRDDMSKLLQAGYAETLEEAYEKAVWARPDIRSTLLQDEQAKRIKEEAEKAKQAKQRASSIKASPSGAETRGGGQSLEQIVRESYSTHS